MASREKVLDFMREFQNRTGMAPTLREIRDAIPEFNWHSSAQYMVNRLKEEDKIEEIKDKGRHRRYAVKDELKRFEALRSSFVPTEQV